jgi:UDP-glucuronate 4-epimerase
MNERFLLTGAYGCIGAWVVRQLVREGVEVIGVDAGLDDSRVRVLLSEDELAQATFIQGDVSDSAQIEQLFSHNPTHVIHLAALQVPECRDNPVLGARVNVVGTVSLFAAAAHASLATPVVYASSAAAFASADGGADAPSEPSGHPGTHYGVFKFANEGTARVFSLDHGLSSIGLRPYVVYGAGRDRGLTSAPTSAMRAAAEGVSYAIPYSGRSEMQYAPDVAAAFIAAARAPYTGATVVNVPGTSALVAEVVEEIELAVPEIAGQITFGGPALPFPEELDSSEFVNIVGPVEITPLRTGVAETISHFRR